MEFLEQFIEQTVKTARIILFGLVASIALLAVLPRAFADGPKATSTPVDELLAEPDEHTAAALKRAAQKSDLEKISSAPSESPSPDNPDTRADDNQFPVSASPSSNAASETPAAQSSPAAPSSASDSEKGPFDTVGTSPPPDKKDSANEASDKADDGSGIVVKMKNKSANKKTTSTNASAVTAAKVIDAATALKWLKNGNNRFVKKQFRADGRGPVDRMKNLSAERPHAILLSCSDSRVPPEILFDQGIGEISVIRVAGEALDDVVIASLEQTVQSTGAQLLVVLGHTRCETIEAVVNQTGDHAGDLKPSDAMSTVYDDIRPRLKTVPATPSHDFEVEAAVNADGITRDILKRSKFLAEREQSGKLVIKSALYHLDTGKVVFY